MLLLLSCLTMNIEVLIMTVNKKIVGLSFVCLAILLTIIAVVYLVVYPGNKKMPEVAKEEQVAGYRYDLTSKEEQMLRQYSIDMHNDYGLEVVKYYVEDITDSSEVIHVIFDDAKYSGEIEYVEGGDWTARLNEVSN